jgi:hypothetical protein
MATIIDSFVVQFGLDIKDLQKHVKDIETSLKKVEGGSIHTEKSISASNKKIGESFSNTIKFVAGFALAIAGVSNIKSFLINVNDQAAATGLLAKNLGMSTEELSTWEKAVQRAGGSAKGMDATLRSMTTMMQTKRLTGAVPSDVLLGLGFGGFGEAGTAKYLADTTTNVERLHLASARLSKLSGPEAQRIGGMLGYDEGTINLLMQGTVAVDKIIAAEQKEYNLTQKRADAALKLSNSWKDLRDSMEGFALDMTSKYGPEVAGAFKWMSDNAQITAEAIGAVTLAANALIASAGIRMLMSVFGVTGLKILARPLLAVGAAAGAGYAAAKAYDKVTSPKAPNPNQSSSGTITHGDVLSQVERKYGLPAGLLNSLRQEESAGGKLTTGPMTKYGTAKGDFQLLDSTAKEYGVKNPYDLGQAAEGTGHKLYDLLREFHGNLPNALAAWNQGQGSIAKNGLGMGVQKFASDIIGRMPNGGSTTVTISKMEVHTNGASAADIGRDAGRTMSSSMAASIANSGLM